MTPVLRLTPLAAVLCLWLPGCGEPTPVSTPELRAARGEERLPQPELAIIWLVGAGPGELAGQSLPSLARLAARGSTMERLYRVATQPEASAAAFWSGRWPHERAQAAARPAESPLGVRLEQLGYSLLSGGEPGPLVQAWCGSSAPGTNASSERRGPGAAGAQGAGNGAGEAPSGDGQESAPRALLLTLECGAPSTQATTDALLGHLEQALAALASPAAVAPDGAARGRLLVLCGLGTEVVAPREVELHSLALVCWPGVVPGGARRPQLANTLDLRATLLELVAGGHSEEVDAAPALERGQSFARLLRQRRQVWRSYVCVEWLAGETWMPWMRTADWSYSRLPGGGARFYSLEVDAQEANDLAGRAEVEALERQHRELLDRWVQEQAYRP